MRFQTLGDKPEFFTSHVRNDAGATIPKGTPVCLSMDGTEDGLAVILPSGASQDLADQFFFGVALDAIAANRIGEVQQFGIVREALIRRATRTASTDNWSASVQSSPLGQLLSINTVDNAFVTVLASSNVAFASTDAGTISYAASRVARAYLGQSISSFPSTNSTASSLFSGTVLTQLVKVFVRVL